MNVSSDFHNAIVAKGIQELLLGSDGDDTIDSLNHLRCRCGILVAHTVPVVLSFFTLNELYVGHLDDAQLDVVIVGAGLIPRLVAKIIAQVLRLELPPVTGQNLVTHQAQLGFRETTQVINVHQIVLQHPADLAFLRNLLLQHTVFQIVGSQYQRVATITVGLAHCQEIHTFLTDIIDTESRPATNGQPPVFTR